MHREWEYKQKADLDRLDQLYTYFKTRWEDRTLAKYVKCCTITITRGYGDQDNDHVSRIKKKFASLIPTTKDLELRDQLDYKINHEMVPDLEELIAAVVLLFSDLEAVHITSLFPTAIRPQERLSTLIVNEPRLWQEEISYDHNLDEWLSEVIQIELPERSIPDFYKRPALKHLEVLGLRFDRFAHEGATYDNNIEVMVLVDPINMDVFHEWIPRFPKLQVVAIHASPCIGDSEEGFVITPDVDRGIHFLADKVTFFHLHNRTYGSLSSLRDFSQLQGLSISINSFFSGPTNWNDGPPLSDLLPEDLLDLRVYLSAKELVDGGFEYLSTYLGENHDSPEQLSSFNLQRFRVVIERDQVEEDINDIDSKYIADMVKQFCTLKAANKISLEHVYFSKGQLESFGDIGWDYRYGLTYQFSKIVREGTSHPLSSSGSESQSVTSEEAVPESQPPPSSTSENADLNSISKTGSNSRLH